MPKINDFDLFISSNLLDTFFNGKCVKRVYQNLRKIRTLSIFTDVDKTIVDT